MGQRVATTFQATNLSEWDRYELAGVPPGSLSKAQLELPDVLIGGIEWQLRAQSGWCGWLLHPGV